MSDPFVITPPRIKLAGETKTYVVDLKAILRNYWIAGRRYALNDYVRAPDRPGLAYQATVAGEAGPTPPPWPRTATATVTDGSVTWTAVAPGTNAVDAISGTPAWATSPAGVTISNQTGTIEEAQATLAGGTAGSTYRITITVSTTAGNVYVVQFDLEVQ